MNTNNLHFDEVIDRATEEERAEHRSRYGFSELTGLPNLKARPGEPLVTSEQVYELLKGFP